MNLPDVLGKTNVTLVILMTRLYAMYFRDKRVLAFISLVWAGAAAGAIYVMVTALQVIGGISQHNPPSNYLIRSLYTLRTAISIHLPLDNTTVCVPTNIPSNFYAFWIPMLVSESCFCTLALLRGFKGYRRGETMIQSGKQLIQVLVRDSLYYFLM